MRKNQPQSITKNALNYNDMETDNHRNRKLEKEVTRR